MTNYIRKHEDGTYEIFIGGESEYRGTAQGVELFGNYFKFKGIGFAMIALECSDDFTIAVFDLSGLLHVIK